MFDNELLRFWTGHIPRKTHPGCKAWTKTYGSSHIIEVKDCRFFMGGWVKGTAGDVWVVVRMDSNRDRKPVSRFSPETRLTVQHSKHTKYFQSESIQHRI